MKKIRDDSQIMILNGTAVNEIRDKTIIQIEPGCRENYIVEVINYEKPGAWIPKKKERESV